MQLALLIAGLLCWLSIEVAANVATGKLWQTFFYS